MSRGEWYYYNAPSPTLYFRGADDGVFRIIAAFDHHVGLEMLDEIERRVFGEDNDEIHAFERRQHICALGVRANWPSRPL